MQQSNEKEWGVVQSGKKRDSSEMKCDNSVTKMSSMSNSS